MNKLSYLGIKGVIYEIKDKYARDILSRLKNLAFKDNASGKITPVGTVSKPVITANISTTNINTVSENGSVATWRGVVENETLKFDFNGGSLPVLSSVNVVNSITNIESSTPVFTGSEVDVNVS